MYLTKNMFALAILLNAGIAVSKEYSARGHVSHNLTLKCAAPAWIDVDNHKFFWMRSIFTDKENALTDEITLQNVDQSPFCSHYEMYFTTDVSRNELIRICHLKIINLQPVDVANYTCFYRRKSGFDTLDTYQVSVGPSNEEIRVDVVEGEPFSLSCYEDGEYPIVPENIRWKPSLLQIRHRDIDFEVMAQKYEKNKSTRADSGPILCYDDKLSLEYTKRFFLDVLYPPTVYVQSSKVRVRENDTLNLECLVEANPWPNVTWTYQETKKPVNGSSAKFRYIARQYFTRATVRLDRVEEKDYGVYVCTAKNARGKSVQTVSVEPPSEESKSDKQGEFRSG